MKLEQVEEIKPNKEEVLIKQVVYPAAQCTAATTNQVSDDINHEGALYIHCSTCGYGVFLGEEGHEKCTYCGVKKNYSSRK